VDFVRRWSEKTELGAGRFIKWLDITASKFYDWRERYGKVNEHNGWVPRDFWLEDWEKQAIIGAGRLSAPDIHDAGCRHRGGESDQRMARVGTSGTDPPSASRVKNEGSNLFSFGRASRCYFLERTKLTARSSTSSLPALKPAIVGVTGTSGSMPTR
jgi:hypothetical protein